MVEDSPPEDPLFVVVLGRALDEEVLFALANLWGARASVHGEVQDPAQVRAWIRRDLARGDLVGVPMIPPSRASETERPSFTFYSPVASIVEFPGGGAEEAGTVVEWHLGVIAHAKFPYACILGPNGAGGDPRYLDACQRATALVSAPFAFGDDTAFFVGPDPQDPRSRAWGITYYGPDLVMALGRETLATAPAAQVVFDDRGGAWLWLDERPFAPSKAKEERRAAVEHHLRLRERFRDDAYPSL